MPRAASGGFLVVIVLRHDWRPPCSGKRSSPSISTCCQSGTDGIDSEDCGERIERCPQVRKNAPMPVHG